MAIKFIKISNILNYTVKGITSPGLNGFKKLNIFVGENNSGKSRFLRQLIEKRNDLIEFEESELYEATDVLYNRLAQAYPIIVGRDEFLLENMNLILKTERQGISHRLMDLKNKATQRVGQNGDSGLQGVSAQGIAREILMELEKPEFKLIGGELKEIAYAYIPILRGLRPLVKEGPNIERYISEDCYRDRTTFDYFKGKDIDNVTIFSGLDIYEQIRDMLLSSTRAEREFVKQFEGFLSEKFFKGKEVILTPTKDRDVITVGIDGDEKAIYDLGDGIQSIICNVFLAYKNKDKNLVLFIEEPEVNLHPGMQRTLVEVLLREMENIQIFLTTHSNHFLDLIYDYEADVSIYSFKKQGGDFLISNITKNRDVIDILGVRNSSVYLSNCVIWLEGVSDRIYLKKLLELYTRDNSFKFREDYHFAFSEYGGSNIENFDFVGFEDDSGRVRVKSIADKNLIIADNDSEKGKDSKKGRRLQNLESLLGEGFIDDYIEVENLIPYRIYSAVMDKLLPLGSSKKIQIKQRAPNTEKKFNCDLLNKKIGRILKLYLVEKKTNLEPAYFKSNNIECVGENKKYIADLIVKEIDDSEITFDELPDHTQLFVRKVVSFIEKKNGFMESEI